MSIPLKAACGVTTITLALAPGIAEAEPRPVEHTTSTEAAQPENTRAVPQPPENSQSGSPADENARTGTQAQESAQTGSQTEGSTQTAPQAEGSTQAAPQAEGSTQAGPQAEGSVQAGPQAEGSVQAGSQARLPAATRKPAKPSLHSRAGRAALLASMQHSVRRKRVQMTAQWQRRANSAVSFAYKQRGRPYVWGGTGPHGFDCSGLVQQAWRRGGVTIPRVTHTQYRKIRTRVSLGKLRPGDLVYFNGRGHVGMYVGKNRFIHSPRTGRTVTVERLRGYYKSRFAGAVRPAWRPLPAIPKSLS
ncbi:NlpC/P60 family protein [Spirillospora sp. CA-294931]|uniref:C40 family peptidase n=1 Tax=Spirillospora sp. CA-294931 TaxID=3240042 RepID=UPI003D940B83